MIRTLAAGKGLTRDLGGDGNTATITEQLIANLNSQRRAGARSEGRDRPGYAPTPYKGDVS